MRRRTLLKHTGAMSLAALQPGGRIASAQAAPTGIVSHGAVPFRRVRPNDPGWPSADTWRRLSDETAGSLFRVPSPADGCGAQASSGDCAAFLTEMKNPYYIGDEPALTETTGWADAWTSSPSAYGVKVRNTRDVVAAVNFARENRLRLVVKGGGHSYQGTSNAADSLLIWTRALDEITLHDDFVGAGCGSVQPPVPAVSVGSGNLWMHVYDAVMTGAGRYVQGGGCTTVGVAGLILGGGFGSFSKRFGQAGSWLLEAEIVTADGAVRLANACTNPDLFWALKGGGGGSFGVVTRLTVRTHDLPAALGAAFGSIVARSDDAFRRLLARFVDFYADTLFGPAWGEVVSVGGGNRLTVAMVFQGIDRATAENAWAPFLDWVRAAPVDFRIADPMRILTLPGRHFWDPAFLRANAPAVVIADDRPGASAANVFWAGNLDEAGWFIHAYDSQWLPASLLEPQSRGRLVDALFSASRIWRVELHTNKGLAGAPPQAIEAAAQTAMHPAVRDAFALAIIAGGGPPAFPGIPGHEPNLARARADASRIGAAMTEMRKLVVGIASYVSESNYFNADWRDAFWGANYPTLRAVKDRYDPEGLFFVHHGVGSEDWSADGFIRST